MKNQQGIASMVIVIMIMMLLTLIVTSMTKNANREQRQALDRQLNSQAFYAAESGINDARDYYTKNANASPAPAPPEKQTCDGLGGSNPGDQFPPPYYSQVGNGTTNTSASYSCVIYDANPDSLEYSDLPVDSSVIAPIEDKSGGPIRSLTITWKRPNTTNYDFSNCSGLFDAHFPKTLTGCDAGVLRTELVDPDPTDRATLISNDFLAYLAPSSNSAAVSKNYDSATNSGQGAKWQGACSGVSDGKCKLTINFGSTVRSLLMLHLRSFYIHDSVEIEGVTTDPATGHSRPIEFNNAQMMIDSTGRASDVLKRIAVRVPLNSYGNAFYPEAAIQTSESICKLLQILPNTVDGDVSSTDCPTP